MTPGLGLVLGDLDPFVADRYLAALRLEAQRRSEPVVETPKARWERYRTDPVGFARDVLGYHLWSKQREICEALVRYDRVAVKSAHQTGKSFTCGGVVVPWWLGVHPPKEAMVVTTAPTFPQVRAILWREINRAHARGRLPGYTNQTEWLIDNELVAFGRKPQDEDPTAFQGIHARYLLVVIDEACGVVGNMFVAAESLVANEGTKILAIGNPDDPGTEFYKVCRPGSGWHVITISAFDTPNLTGEEVPDAVRAVLIGRSWVEDKARAWGETSPLYQSKVLGEFPEVSDDTLVQPGWVTAAVVREIEPDPGDPNELGVDVARSENRNETVIYHRHGSRARLWRALRTRDTMRIVGLVIQAAIETGARRIKVDDNGVGGGVTDRLTEVSREREHDGRLNPFHGAEIVGVNVGVAPIERRSDRREGIDPRDRFANLKSQLSWELRERFREGDVDLGDDLDTQAQICAIRYDTNSRGKLRIEGKDEVEKRLSTLGGMTAESGSPDRWDALVLAFAEVEETVAVVVSDAAVRAARMGAMLRRRF
jgi:hypothetical protein